MRDDGAQAPGDTPVPGVVQAQATGVVQAPGLVQAQGEAQTQDEVQGEAQALAVALLAAGRALVDGISAGVKARGFGDVRPAHGFAFTRLAPGGATLTQLARHLGVSRQAAAQLVDELTAKGYVERRPHPSDARARLIVLTQKGWACTRAAEAAMADTVRPWAETLGQERLRALRDGLTRIAPRGPLRPLW